MSLPEPIPIYIQYYDENKNIVTKEVTHKDYPDSQESETSASITITNTGSTIKFTFVPSSIKFAAAQARRWAERNNIKVYLSSYIFTTDAPSEWWTLQPKNASYVNGYYSPETMSYYKKQGYGIIIRDAMLPPVKVPEGKKSFTESHIPI